MVKLPESRAGRVRESQGRSRLWPLFAFNTVFHLLYVSLFLQSKTNVTDHEIRRDVFANKNKKSRIVTKKRGIFALTCLTFHATVFDGGISVCWFYETTHQPT